ncbi:MAG: YlmC/YmxH family sporulation protein [Clostridiaceae bacterium]|jgi:YlmC/YmxH family sporulation protein|nr:YlmC/YmxH family sporulation protein [Clostridiaceae bacterium]
MQQEMKNSERNSIQLPNSNISRIVELRQKEVINMVDGRRLGYVKDIEFSLETGRLLSVVLPGPWSFSRFFTGETELVIPWRDIRKIGEEIILVDIKE